MHVIMQTQLYLEANILQMVGVPLYDLFDEVWMRGFKVRAGWLVKLKLKTSPQLWHVESLVPLTTHLGGISPVQKWKVLEDV